MMGVEATKHQTRRGLDSRARSGHHTGGPCYGYRTEDEPDPADPTRPRKVLVIHEPEAETIREIFRRFAAGESHKEIATDLSERGIPGPRSANKKWALWGATSSRFICLNRRYIGELVWNQRRYVKDPTSGKRRPVPRPAAEHVTTVRPELAIVPLDLFRAVQARFRKAKPGRQEGSVTRHPPHPLRGLIKCGVCGGSMTIHLRRGSGRDLVTLVRCSTNTNRGAAGCPNGKTVAVHQVVDTLYSAAVETRAKPERREALVDAVLASYQREAEDPGAHLRLELAAVQARVTNMVEAIASVGLSPDLAAAWKAALARKEELEIALGDIQPPKPAPSREDILRVLEGMADVDTRRMDSTEVAAQLRARLAVVHVEPEGGGWTVTATFRDVVNRSSGGEI